MKVTQFNLTYEENALKHVKALIEQDTANVGGNLQEIEIKGDLDKLFSAAIKLAQNQLLEGLQVPNEILKEKLLPDGGLDIVGELVVKADLPNEEALKLKMFYPDWAVGVKYAKDVIVNYDGELYRVFREHTSQADWLPNKQPDLYIRVKFAEDGTPEWVQPTGYENAYKKGAIVKYNGQKWESLQDGNIWTPEAGALWKLAEGSEENAATDQK